MPGCAPGLTCCSTAALASPAKSLGERSPHAVKAHTVLTIAVELGMLCRSGKSQEPQEDMRVWCV